uniref:DUF6106 family protein n=1 Tax=Agathobacter sp. TaxID=2021311 RepID=UPI0040561FAD
MIRRIITKGSECMLEVYVLADRKKSFLERCLSNGLILLGVVFLYATLFYSFVLISLSVLAFILGFIFTRRRTEYEYSYFDGDVRFAKIINKSKRKNLRGYVMDNILIIAPEGDRSVYNYENDAQAKKRDLSTGRKDVKVYVMVAKTESGMEVTRFEPDEKYLDAVCVKYPQKVIR